MELPIARLGDKCVSPKGKSGTITTASSDFFVDGRGAARVGDTVTYTDGKKTTLAQGDPFVFDGPQAIVRQTFLLADGGRVVQGSPRATSGSPTPGAGSVAERTLVAARANAQPFVPINCDAKVAATLLDEVGEGPLDESLAGPPRVPLHADAADGGAPEMHIMPSGGPPDGAGTPQAA